MSENREVKGKGDKRKPLRVAITEIDRDILRLLARRQNLLDKIRRNGHLESSEEKYLRESWQTEVARVSRDPELSGRFFSLMQQLSFLPRSVAGPDETPPQAGKRRGGFNLAPPKLPVEIRMDLPPSWRQSCFWIYMAAAAGATLRIENVLQNNDVVACARGLTQMGAAIAREDNAIAVLGGSAPGTPDRAIYIGDDEFNFYLFTAHYLGRPGRVKFIGPAALQLADYSALDRILPALGARMVHIIPKSSGLPVRLETSGILPPGLDAPADCPLGFLEALLIAAPFYAAPFAINLAQSPYKPAILAHVLPIFQSCGITYALQGDTISIEPGALSIPVAPAIPAEPEVGAYLLAFASVLGGRAALRGEWPDWPEIATLWQMCQSLAWQRDVSEVYCQARRGLTEFQVTDSPGLAPDWAYPLFAALAACAALHGGNGRIQPVMRDDPITQDFLRVAGLACAANNNLAPTGERPTWPWNAPSASWALAYALTACARPGPGGWLLGNAEIMRGLWPDFWQFYNSLPNPEVKNRPEPAMQPLAKQRRRIMTGSIAIPPPEKKDV